MVGSLFHVPGDALDGPVDIRSLDLDLVGLGRLNLQRLVDQIAQHLLPQLVELVGGNLTAIGDRQELQTLINIGLRDHVAIHDRRRLDD